MKSVYVRLYTLKIVRQYGSRGFAEIPHICEAVFVANQPNGTIIVELLKDCATYKAGRKIAIYPRDYDVQR